LTKIHAKFFALGNLPRNFSSEILFAFRSFVVKSRALLLSLRKTIIAQSSSSAFCSSEASWLLSAASSFPFGYVFSGYLLTFFFFQIGVIIIAILGLLAAGIYGIFAIITFLVSSWLLGLFYMFW
jgi:hypothetical protein